MTMARIVSSFARGAFLLLAAGALGCLRRRHQENMYARGVVLHDGEHASSCGSVLWGGGGGWGSTTSI
jgi:hypothetical protein